jgi:hypothetical protein
MALLNNKIRNGFIAAGAFVPFGEMSDGAPEKMEMILLLQQH